MCWEKEDEYGNYCFDFLWNDFGACSWTDCSIVKALKNIGVKIINNDKCEEEFMELLSKWHEKGLIKPK